MILKNEEEELEVKDKLELRDYDDEIDWIVYYRGKALSGKSVDAYEYLICRYLQ